MTQTEAVLSHLKSHKRMTSMDAIDMGITRLSARIYDLRKSGKKIVSTNIKKPTRWGPTTCVEYRLIN